MGSSTSEDKLSNFKPDCVRYFKFKVEHADASVQDKCVLVDLLLAFVYLGCSDALSRNDNLSLCVLNWIVKPYSEPIAFKLEFRLPFSLLLLQIRSFWIQH